MTKSTISDGCCRDAIDRVLLRVRVVCRDAIDRVLLRVRVVCRDAIDRVLLRVRVVCRDAIDRVLLRVRVVCRDAIDRVLLRVRVVCRDAIDRVLLRVRVEGKQDAINRVPTRNNPTCEKTFSKNFSTFFSCAYTTLLLLHPLLKAFHAIFSSQKICKLVLFGQYKTQT